MSVNVAFICIADSGVDTVVAKIIMSKDPKTIAESVVDAFRERLEPELRDSIDEHHFTALQGMVREAISEHAEAIVERLDRDLKQVKSDMVERRPLEL